MVTEQIATFPAAQEDLPVPPVLSEYDRLVSTDARNTFGTRIEEEGKLLGVERATVNSELHDLDARRDNLLAGNVPDSEHDAISDSIQTDADKLHAQARDLRRRELFAASREARWSNGYIQYDRHDPAVADLVEGLSKNAETEEQTFIQDSKFDKLADMSNALVIDAKDQPLEFPAASVISAIGFESWETGRGGQKMPEELKGVKKSSREVMEDYASRDTPVPPLEHATALILEDGRIVIKASNAHRAGAAKLRGQTIQVKELKVWRAKESQPQEVAAEGLGVVAVAGTVISRSEEQREQTVPTEQAAPSALQLSRWQRFMARVNYFRKHRQSS